MHRATTRTKLPINGPYRKVPPGPRGHLLLGSLRDFRRDHFQFLLSVTRRYGDVVRFRFAFWHGYLFNHPDYVKHILVDNHLNYSKNTIDNRLTKPLLGEGLLTSEGTYWLRQRRLCQPAFHRHRIMDYVPLMVETTIEMLERWHTFAVRGQPLDVAVEMVRLTMRIVSKALFRIDLSNNEADDVDQALLTAVEYFSERFYSPLSLVPRLPTPRNRQFRAALHRLDEIVYRIIEEGRRRDAYIDAPSTGSGQAPSTDSGQDLLSILLQARDEETGEGMTDQQLRDQVLTFLLAGYDTTAHALTWTWYLLSKNPAVERRLYQEVTEVLNGRLPSAEDLPALQYTHMVFKEALRLYPPAWVFTRTPIQDDKIGGYPIPAGSMVVVSPFAMHRHLAFWENPEGFDPERFTPERSAGRPPFAYFPFGGGPRLCIGNTFAMTEAQVILAMVTQRYQLHLVPGYPVEPEPLGTLRPRYGVLMTIRERSG